MQWVPTSRCYTSQLDVSPLECHLAAQTSAFISERNGPLLPTSLCSLHAASVCHLKYAEKQCHCCNVLILDTFTMSGTQTVRRRRTLANLELPSTPSASPKDHTKHDSYATSTGLDEFTADKSPLSPRLSLRAEMENRGKPPRGRPLGRTPPTKARGKQRPKTRIAEFTQEQVVVQPHVSKRKRWLSVCLVWAAIVCAVIVAYWLRFPGVLEDVGGLADIDAADNLVDSVSSGELWDQIAFEDVLG